VTASAFIFADGGTISPELKQLQYIQEFGARAAMGRTLGYGEMQRMRHAQFIVDAFQSRKQSKSWDAWAKDNPGAAQVLFDGVKLAKEMFNYG